MTKTAKPLKKKPADPPADLPELYSTLQLEKILGVSRLTISNRLRNAGIDPHPTSTANNRLYELTEAVKAAVTRKDSEKTDVDIQGGKLKNKKLEIEVDILAGRKVDIDEVSNHTSDLFGGLHKRIVVQNLDDLVRKVRGAKDAATAKEIARRILNQPFMDARENYTRFLK